MEQELFSLDEVKSGLKSFFSGLIQNAKEEVANVNFNKVKTTVCRI